MHSWKCPSKPSPSPFALLEPSEVLRDLSPSSARADHRAAFGTKTIAVFGYSPAVPRTLF
jgi:hypothetical protein